MLIVTSKSPGGGKVKPKQWGPLSQVQAAVRHNAEWLGIDPEIILAYWPTWEGSGLTLHDIFAVHDILGDTGTWTANSFNPGSTSYDGLINNNADIITLPETYSFSLWVVASASAVDEGSSFHWGGTDDILLYPYDISGRGTRIFWRDVGGNIFQTNNPLSLNTDHSFIFSSVASNKRQLFIDGDLFGTHTTTGAAGPFSSVEFAANSEVVSSGGTRFINYQQTVLFRSDISEEIALRLHETPYALLMPRTPTFYSFATAGGGTTYFQSITGDMPASSGGVSASTMFSQSVTGTLPSMYGAIIKQINKSVSGIMGDISGNVSKLTSKSMSGNMPPATGSVSPSFRTSQSVAGILGAFSGAVTDVLNPVVAAVKKAYSQLMLRLGL